MTRKLSNILKILHRKITTIDTTWKSGSTQRGEEYGNGNYMDKYVLI